MRSSKEKLFASSGNALGFAGLLVLAVVGINLLLFGLCRHVVQGSYRGLEKKHAAEHLSRAKKALNRSVLTLGRNVTDEANWDSSYGFIQDGNPQYVRMNLVDSVFTEMDVQLILFIRTDGTIVYSRWSDPDTADSGVFEKILQTPELWNFSSTNQRLEGLWESPAGPLMFAARPILTSDGEGPVHGSLMMARLIDDEQVRQLSATVEFPLEIEKLGNTGNEMSSDPEIRIRDDHVETQVVLNDVFGQPLLSLRGEMPLELVLEGRRTVLYFLAWSTGLSSVLGGAIYFTWLGWRRNREGRRERELLFRSLTSQAPEAFFLFRDKESFLDFNTRACALLGYTSEEFECLAWRDVEAEVGFVLVSELLESVPEGQAVTSEGHLRCKDGSELPVEWSASKLNWKGETYILVLARDIRERKHAEKSLRQERQKYAEISFQFKTVLDGIADSIVLLSKERRIVWANQAARQIYNESGCEDGCCHGMWPGLVHDSGLCPVLECLRRGRPVEDIGRFGQEQVWGIKVFPLKDDGGNVQQVVQVASDITEKVQLRREAEQAARLAALGELSAGIAHEVNNPTAYMLLNLAFLQDVFCDLLPLVDEDGGYGSARIAGLPLARVREKTPALIQEMQNGAQKIKRIVEDLKNFARPESGDEKEKVDVNEVIETSTRMVAHVIRKATRKFTLDLAAGLPAVCGNGQNIEQVVVNLLLNACQALESSEQEVGIASRFDATHNTVLIEVRDQGRGIAAKNLEKLTHPFFTTRRETGGTGLGLSVSARIVDRHRGTLRFQSQPGHGTTVTVALPKGE